MPNKCSLIFKKTNFIHLILLTKYAVPFVAKIPLEVLITEAALHPSSFWGSPEFTELPYRA